MIALRAAPRVRIMEWSGSVLGLLGAFLLASNTALSAYGWFAFLGANVALIGFAVAIRANGLLLQQLGFLASSALGIARAFFPS